MRPKPNPLELVCPCGITFEPLPWFDVTSTSPFAMSAPMPLKDREARRAYQRAWRERNREKINALRRERGYSSEQLALRAQASQRWRKKNPERLAEDNRNYYLANRERILVRSKEYHARDPERWREKAREWRQANPDWKRELDRATQMRRRARKAAVTVEYVDPLHVFERDGWICQICGCDTRDKRNPAPDSPTIDHIVPISRGGPHSYANTQCLCRRCNRLKGASVDV